MAAPFKIAGGTLSQAFKKIEQAHEKAAIRALNRTAASVRTASVRAMARDLGVPQKPVRDATTIRRAAPGRNFAEVVAKGKRIPLRDFKARQTRKGVSYRIGQARKLILGGFIARMASGHVGVFTRAGRERLPIQEKFGPSIPRVFSRRRIYAAMRTVMKDKLPKEFKSALAFYLR